MSNLNVDISIEAISTLLEIESAQRIFAEHGDVIKAEALSSIAKGIRTRIEVLETKEEEVLAEFPYNFLPQAV